MIIHILMAVALIFIGAAAIFWLLCEAFEFLNILHQEGVFGERSDLIEANKSDEVSE